MENKKNQLSQTVDGNGLIEIIKGYKYNIFLYISHIWYPLNKKLLANELINSPETYEVEFLKDAIRIKIKKIVTNYL